MVLKKRGQIFSFVMFILAITVFIAGYWTLHDQTKTFGGIGEKSFEMLDAHQRMEKALITHDYLMKGIAHKEAYNLLESGGGEACGKVCLLQDKSACKQQVSLYAEQGKAVDACIPDWQVNYFAAVDKSYRERSGLLENIYRYVVFEVQRSLRKDEQLFEYSLVSDFTGTRLIGIDLGSMFNAEKGFLELTRKASFNVGIPVDLLIFNEAEKGLGKVVEGCSQATIDNLEKCASEAVQTFSNDWKVGEACGEDAVGDRLVLFCIHSGKTAYLISDVEKFTLRFAAYIPFGVNFYISELKMDALDVIEGATFVGKDEISYSGQLEFVAPVGAGDIAGFIEREDGSQIPLQFTGNGKRYSFSGEYTAVPGDIKFVFSAGEIVKASEKIRVQT